MSIFSAAAANMMEADVDLHSPAELLTLSRHPSTFLLRKRALSPLRCYAHQPPAAWALTVAMPALPAQR